MDLQNDACQLVGRCHRGMFLHCSTNKGLSNIPIFCCADSSSIIFLPKFTSKTAIFQVVYGHCIYGIWSWPGQGWRLPAAAILGFVQSYILFIFLGFCYGTILWKLSRRTALSDDSQSHRNDVYQKARRNVAVNFCIAAFFFMVCWVQHRTIWLMFSLGHPIVFWNGVYFQLVVVNMVYLNCTVNPTIYLVKSTDFQNALRELMSCKQETALGNQWRALPQEKYPRETVYNCLCLWVGIVQNSQTCSWTGLLNGYGFLHVEIFLSVLYQRSLC